MTECYSGGLSMKNHIESHLLCIHITYNAVSIRTFYKVSTCYYISFVILKGNSVNISQFTYMHVTPIYLKVYKYYKQIDHYNMAENL